MPCLAAATFTFHCFSAPSPLPHQLSFQIKYQEPPSLLLIWSSLFLLLSTFLHLPRPRPFCSLLCLCKYSNVSTNLDFQKMVQLSRFLPTDWFHSANLIGSWCLVQKRLLFLWWRRNMQLFYRWNSIIISAPLIVDEMFCASESRRYGLSWFFLSSGCHWPFPGELFCWRVRWAYSSPCEEGLEVPNGEFFFQ